VLAVLGLSLVLILTVQPSRKIPIAGDIAKERIKSSGDFLVEDMKTTEQNRLAAQEAVLNVYDFDPPEELSKGSHGALREHTDIESAENPSHPDGEGKKGDGSPPQSVGLS